MSEIERLCKELLQTNDSKNIVHYLETHTIEDIGIYNLLKVIRVLDEYVVSQKEILK